MTGRLALGSDEEPLLLLGCSLHGPNRDSVNQSTGEIRAFDLGLD